MQIVVQPPRKPQMVEGDDVWLLVEDLWNDYGFQTSYTLYKIVGLDIVTVGGVKILRRGQPYADFPLPHGPLPDARLPEDCISLGASLDYYAQLIAFGRPQASNMLTRMRDLSADTDLETAFKTEEGLEKSLHRSVSEPADYYFDARSVIETGGLPPRANAFSFDFRPGESAPAITFEFAARRGGGSQARLPSRRTIILIGENGAGKTHLLASLARVAYAAPAERGGLKDFGRIEPDDTVFPGLMAVSYSAFDTFKPPELEGDDREEVANKVRDGTGRYSYCGMRDLAAHIRDPEAPEKLIAPSELEAMFVDRLNRIRESQRLQAFALAMAPALGENSMSRYLPPPEADDEGKPVDLDAVALTKAEAFLGPDPAASFRGLSSGHKIVAHLLAGITASIRRRSLVLIDEPETHLHPPLLAALMAGIQRLLDRFEAYAIIATHSPVVAQETLSSQVFIMEGEGVVRRPGIQTFGENTGALTREIFGLHTEATEHRRVLDLLAQDFADPEAIERALGEPLSGQALAFILSKQRNKR